MESLWGEVMEAVDEMSSSGKQYFCGVSLLCWIIDELLPVVWTSRELVWWNILALYTHHLAKNIHAFGCWMLAFVWVCLRLSPDEDWLEITHPAERATFNFGIASPALKDLYIAFILLAKLDFLASAWKSRRSLRQLPAAVSNLFTLSVGFEIPVSTAWVQGYIPAGPGSLSDAETLQLLAEAAERRNRGDNTLKTRSRGTIPTRRNQGCECEPCLRINRAEPSTRNETCDRGTQTALEPSKPQWPDWDTSAFLPFRTQPVCPCTPCQCTNIKKAPKPLTVDEDSSTAPAGAEETQSDTIKEEEPRSETTPMVETLPVTVIPVIDLTDGSQPVGENEMVQPRVRSSSPLDPRIPSIRYRTRHGAEIPDEPESPDVPEATNDTQVEVTNGSPLADPPSEPEVTSDTLQPRASPAASPFSIFKWSTNPEDPNLQGGLEAVNEPQVHDPSDMFAHLRGSNRLVGPPASNCTFRFESTPVPKPPSPELRGRPEETGDIQETDDIQDYEEPGLPVAVPPPVPDIYFPEKSDVPKIRSLDDTNGPLQINNSNNLSTSTEVESRDINASPIKEIADQQDSAGQTAQPYYTPGIDYYDIDYTPDFSKIPPLPDSPLDSATRQADYFRDPPVLPELPPLPDSPPTPHITLSIRTRVLETYEPSGEGSDYKNLADSPKNTRGAPDGEGTSEIKDNEIPARETTPVAPYEGSDPELSDPDLYDCSDDNASGDNNPRETSRPVATGADYGNYRDEEDDIYDYSGDEAPPSLKGMTGSELDAALDALIAEDDDIYDHSGDEVLPNLKERTDSKLDAALDSIISEGEEKYRSRHSSDPVSEYGSNLEQPYDREGSPMESVYEGGSSLREHVHERGSSPMDCDEEPVPYEEPMMDTNYEQPGFQLPPSFQHPRESWPLGESFRSSDSAPEPTLQEFHDRIRGRTHNEDDDSVIDTHTDIAGEPFQTADIDMVDSPSTQIRDFGDLDSIYNDAQIMPSFPTLQEEFQQTAQTQGSDAFQDSNTGSRFTNMMDEIQREDRSTGPALPLSLTQLNIPGLNLFNPPIHSEAKGPNPSPAPEESILRYIAPLLNSPAQASVSGHTVQNTTMPESNDRMEVQVSSVQTETEYTEDDIGNSKPLFDEEARNYHAILDATIPLPSKEPPATRTGPEDSDSDESDSNTDPAPSSRESGSKVPSTQEEIAARPKLTPRLHGGRFSRPTSQAGPSQQPETEKGGEKGKGKADDSEADQWDAINADFDRLNQLGTWDSSSEDSAELLERLLVAEFEKDASRGEQDTATNAGPSENEIWRTAGFGVEDQQETTSHARSSEEDSWKPYETEYAE